MSSVTIERLLKEVKKLAPDERRQLREALDGEAHHERGERPEGKGQEIGGAIDLSRELRWVSEHRAEYVGQWVAVRGDRLLASGHDARSVYQAARDAGDERPFLTHVEPADELPFGGW